MDGRHQTEGHQRAGVNVGDGDLVEEVLGVIALLEVETDAPLVSVDPGEGHAVVGPGIGAAGCVAVVGWMGREGAEAVAGRWLDLDDVGPEVGQQGGTERPGVGHGAVDDGHIIEGASSFCCRHRVGLLVAGQGGYRPSGSAIY